ncbi:hypothetical protein [Levilinea saccharolytica]|uniref:Uncharacterized protein n=1 Tax=Levilinea saccharolytica TaxID=229921 RepID=A0A0P6XSL1_9CHLR|nr:hypothetical protein [Levilinea saccharolytica]KPL75741.1 hypothetical protein ADN01_18140 [Levilinea saccharolytica]GAP16694.1 hypothetical protein LSAC_00550 [Levilinea saccharolytica]
MTINLSPLTEIVIIFLFIYLLVAMFSREDFERSFSKIRTLYQEASLRVSNLIVAPFAQIVKYFDATDLEINERINKNTSWEVIANNISTLDIAKTDEPLIANQIKIEKIVGSTLGTIIFLAMIYVNSLELTEALNNIGIEENPPSFLRLEMTYRVMIHTFGIAVSNGIYISDLLNNTSFTSASHNRGRIRKLLLFLRIVCIGFTLIVLLLLTMKDSTIPYYALAFLQIPLMLTLMLSANYIHTGVIVLFYILFYVIRLLLFLWNLAIFFTFWVMESLLYLLLIPLQKIVHSSGRYLSKIINKKG